MLVEVEEQAGIDDDDYFAKHFKEGVFYRPKDEMKGKPRDKHTAEDYFEIIDGRTLLPIQLFEDTDYAVAVAAVWVGEVRLIDNIILKQAIVESDIDSYEFYGKPS